jgi:hypothetical protein
MGKREKIDHRAVAGRTRGAAAAGGDKDNRKREDEGEWSMAKVNAKAKRKANDTLYKVSKMSRQTTEELCVSPSASTASSCC